MLTGKIINSQATLNNFKYLNDVEFLISSAFTFGFRIMSPELGDRFVLPSTAIVTLTFNNADTSTFTKVATFIDAGDRSMMSVALLSTDTPQLLGGNISFSVDLLGDQTQIVSGIMFNVLRRIISDCGC